jgi:hypothetical protein
LVAISLVFIRVSAQFVVDVSIETLCLTITGWMVGCGKNLMYTSHLSDALENLEMKLPPLPDSRNIGMS